jgi:hypothetical protein
MSEDGNSKVKDGNSKVKWWVSGIVGPIIAGVAVWYLTGPNGPFQHPKPPPAIQGTINVPAGNLAYVYVSPSMSAEIVDEIGDGQTVQIRCTAQGQVVTANGLSSSLWDDIGPGYVPDVVVYTGTNQATMPNC